MLAQCTPDQAVQNLSLAGVIVLCSRARDFTLTVPLSTQGYKWVCFQIVGVNYQMLGNNQNPTQEGVTQFWVYPLLPGKDMVLPSKTNKEQEHVKMVWQKKSVFSMQKIVLIKF